MAEVARGVWRSDRLSAPRPCHGAQSLSESRQRLQGPCWHQDPVDFILGWEAHSREQKGSG